jgi:hypothetical protein
MNIQDNTRLPSRRGMLSAAGLALAGSVCFVGATANANQAEIDLIKLCGRLDALRVACEAIDDDDTRRAYYLATEEMNEVILDDISACWPMMMTGAERLALSIVKDCPDIFEPSGWCGNLDHTLVITLLRALVGKRAANCAA